MGKLKKQRKKGFNDNPVIEEHLDINTEEIKKMTKGELQKKQNMEWKKLRKTLADLAKEKKTYSNKDTDEKKEKKVLRKHMIELKEQMEERHKRELEEWDRFVVSLFYLNSYSTKKNNKNRRLEEEKNQKELDSIQAPKLSTSEQARLKQMFNSFL